MVVFERQSGLRVTERTASVGESEPAVWIIHDSPVHPPGPSCDHVPRKSLRHLNLSLPPREAWLPQSPSLLYLQPTKQCTPKEYLASTYCMPGTAEYTWSAYCGQKHLTTPHDSIRLSFFPPRFTSRETEGQRGYSDFFLVPQFELLSECR